MPPDVPILDPRSRIEGRIKANMTRTLRHPHPQGNAPTNFFSKQLEADGRSACIYKTPGSFYISAAQPMHSYSVDFEEGDICTPIFSSIVPDWNHRRASRYFDQDDAECDNDDDSIRSSRPCTPPGLTMSHWSTSVPSAPGPKPAPSARVATTPPSPSPQPQSRWGSMPSYSTASSATVIMAGAPSASAGRDARAATRWTIPPDVYRKAESALARITAMSRGSSASASDRGCAPTHRYSSERDAGPTTGGYDGRDNCHMSSAPLQKHREPPRSPRKSVLAGRPFTCLIDWTFLFVPR